ncbi:hypothetical protein OROGR_020457 [Orobanche gracilis]
MCQIPVTGFFIIFLLLKGICPQIQSVYVFDQFYDTNSCCYNDSGDNRHNSFLSMEYVLPYLYIPCSDMSPLANYKA